MCFTNDDGRQAIQCRGEVRLALNAQFNRLMTDLSVKADSIGCTCTEFLSDVMCGFGTSFQSGALKLDLQVHMRINLGELK